MTHTSPAAEPADPRELMSRLADGDCDGQAALAACAHWAEDAAMRETWHRYHLIGDVLRSDDLSGLPGHDADFLHDLRQRLAAELPIAAPGRLARHRAAWGRWTAPAALAAGVAVAGVLVVLLDQQAAPPESAPLLVSTSDASMIRDARLDMYLQAHHGMRSGPTAAMAGGSLHKVDLLLPAR